MGFILVKVNKIVTLKLSGFRGHVIMELDVWWFWPESKRGLRRGTTAECPSITMDTCGIDSGCCYSGYNPRRGHRRYTEWIPIRDSVSTLCRYSLAKRAHFHWQFYLVACIETPCRFCDHICSLPQKRIVLGSCTLSLGAIRPVIIVCDVHQL